MRCAPALVRAARYGGVFLVMMSNLMLELLLTRIFSATMWYHFAFMAISIAMFGMTVGALAVFLRPQAWPEATLPAAMGRCALLFAVALVAFELFVAGLQAYVFTILSAVYIAGALEPEH